jgi:L-ribulose-5-phosphate 3-epimerase
MVRPVNHNERRSDKGKAVVSNLIVAHANSYHTYGFDDALKGIAEAGYTNIELSAVEGWTEHIHLDDDPDAVRTRVDGHGLEAVALAGHSDLTTDYGLAVGVRGIEWAAAYGLKHFTTAIGGHASRAESREAFLERIGTLAGTAERLGLTIALEIHGEIMASGEATRPLIDEIGSDAVRVKYDTGNCEYYGGVSAVDDIHHVMDLLVNIDAKDKLGGQGVWNFPAPGAGHVDWPRLVAILRRAGYDGFYTVEIEFEGTWPPLPEVNRAMRSAREYLTELLA